MADPIVGIDLGTSNTVVASADEMGNVQVLADDAGYKIHPSVVSFHPNGGVVVGAAAKQRKVIDPTNTVFSAKRLIGRRFQSNEVQIAKTRMPYQIKEGSNHLPMIVTRAGEFAIPEISAIILDHVRNIATARLGSEVARAVITVPASFNDAQRSATATAGAVAGLAVVRVLNEPTAAALAYGNSRNLKQTIAVYDFGGGTFDVTILRLEDQVYEVLGTAGDNFLGGDDLDERLVDKMVNKFLQENRIDLRSNEVSMMRLRAVAEQTKIELSRRSRAVVRIDEIAYGPKGAPLNLQIELTRDEFVTEVASIIDRTFPVCQEAMSLANLDVGRIDDVLLVGGTTKIPYVRDQVSRFFGKAPRTDIAPEEAVAVGAALQATSLERILGRKSDARVSAAVPIHNEEDTNTDLFAISQVAIANAPPLVTNTTENPALNTVTNPSLSTVTNPSLNTVTNPDLTIPESARTRPSKPPTEYAMRGNKDHIDQTPLPIGRVGRTIGAPVPAPPVTTRLNPANPNAKNAFGVAPPPGLDAVPITPAPSRTAPVPAQNRPPARGVNRSQAPVSATAPTMVTMEPEPPLATAPTKVQAVETPVSPHASTLVTSNPNEIGLPGTAPGVLPPRQPAQTIVAKSGTTPPPPRAAPPSVPPPRQSAPSVPPAMGPMPRAPIASKLVAPPPIPPPVAPPFFEPSDEPLAHASTLVTHIDSIEGAPPASTPIRLPTESPAVTARGIQPTRQPPQTYPVSTAAAATIMAPAQPVQRPMPVVLDVTPRSLGIGTVAGFCEELIRRNARLPQEIKKIFTTSRDSQELVRIVVCQGESRRLENNVVIGDLLLEDLPQRPRGETSIEVTFALDASGILVVSAKDAQTGKEQRASLDIVGTLPQGDVAAARERVQQLRR